MMRGKTGRMRKGEADERGCDTLESADIAANPESVAAPLSVPDVDRIINMRGNESAIEIKNVTANGPVPRPFPGNPVFPGCF